MSFNIEFDFDERAFQRAVRKDVEDHLAETSRDMTREFARLSTEYAGQPVEKIKPALKRVWERDGGTITDPELTEYAELISDGTEITFEPGQIDW